MSIKHYEGRLGKFDYDTTQFKLIVDTYDNPFMNEKLNIDFGDRWDDRFEHYREYEDLDPDLDPNYDPDEWDDYDDYLDAEAGMSFWNDFYEDESGNIMPREHYDYDWDDDSKFENYKYTEPVMLHYIGKEKDGRKINVPDGLIDGTGLFMNTNIEIGANIPNSVIIRDQMYACCKKLKIASDVSFDVVSIRDYVIGCESLQKAPIVYSDTEKIDQFGDFTNDNVKSAIDWNLKHRGQDFNNKKSQKIVKSNKKQVDINKVLSNANNVDDKVNQQQVINYGE